MMANGSKMFSMVMEKKHGLTDLFMRENTGPEKSKDMVITFGKTVQNIKENGLKTKSKDLELTRGLTVVTMLVSGLIIIWRA